MSSQSAQHRTTHSAALRERPSEPQSSPQSAGRVGSSQDARLSWLWLPGIIAGAYILFAYAVPFSANLLVELFH